MGKPPVCKLMDYGKFKYENAQKAREARRNQTNVIIKEMKLRPKIDAHDYETKKGHVVRFLKAGDKVKITIMFRGREQHRPELGFRLLQKLAEDVTELGFVESSPKQDGRNMIMVLGPHKKKAEAKVEQKAAKEERAAERAAEAPPSTPSAPPHAPPVPWPRRRSAVAPRTWIPRSRPDEVRTPSNGLSTTTDHCDARSQHRTTYEERHMPKNKTHSGARSASRSPDPARSVRQKAGLRHNLEKMPSKVTRRLVRHHRGRQGRRQARQEAARPLSLTPRPRPDHLIKEH